MNGKRLGSMSLSSTRRQVVGLLGAGAVVSLLPGAMAATPAGGRAGARPNVVLIVLDDIGFAELGAFGSEIHTPTIDALAQAGLRYNHFDSKAICAPTRASLLTGRNCQTVHMEDLPPTRVKGPPPGTPFGQGLRKAGEGLAISGEMPLNAETLPMALRSAGYSTYALGKWHLCPTYSDQPERNKVWMPLQRGFDYYYGFLSGHSDQYHPPIVENNDPPFDPYHPGYHLSVDLIDHAITKMDPAKDPGKPKFLYLAMGAAHSPYQVPKAYVDAYRGHYNEGWDVLREARFERQKRMGIIPANTKLPPREKGDAAWETLDEQHKRVFARFMETYAGFITHADEQIGRLINYLKTTGQYDNTLFILLTDNGAASEGGPNGGWNREYADKTPVTEMDAHLDEAGSPTTHMLYQRPWAYAGDTSLRRYKLWPFLGGVRTPLMISWQARIKDRGAIRRQYVDMIDLAPTILEAAGSAFAAKVDGVEQIPVAGKSILKTVVSPTAPTRSVQFFELRGNRAITQGKWRAVAMHKIGTSHDDDLWQLFDTEADFSESTDLSKRYPEKLAELKKLWWSEAKKYTDMPLIEPVPFLYKMNGIDDAFD
jgi:arylsulfatase A-like enzyme